MQWLINIITANVISTIGIPPCFIDRGDAGVYDWTTANFTKDAAWHVLDLSGIIPTNATGVLFAFEAAANAINQLVLFKPRVGSGVSNYAGINTQIANVALKSDIAVAIGDNRTIYYLATPVVWAVLSLGVKGWWL